jgi:hypothetical protein
MNSLSGLDVLIVQDEYRLAAELARRCVQAGAAVIGPTYSVAEALDEILNGEKPGAAVLDVKPDGDAVFPVADVLTNLEIPFVFFGGDDDAVLPERFSGAPQLPVSANCDQVLAALVAAGAKAEPAKVPAPARPLRTPAASLLPKLLSAARLLVDDLELAEALARRTLERALNEFLDCPPDMSFESWLLGLLHTTPIDVEPGRLN